MTNLEKKLWEALYRTTTALAKRCLDEANEKRGEEGEWPADQKWNELGGSSQAIFHRIAREEAGVDHDWYLDLLRNNQDASAIAEEAWEQLQDG